METNCKNCQARVLPEYDYCPKCSQKINLHRLSLHEVLHEFIHYFTHADKGFFQLLRDLATKNGAVAREYVEGKRKKYFPPLNFFLLISGIYVLFATDFHREAELEIHIPKTILEIKNPTEQAHAVAVYERRMTVGPFMDKYSNMLSMAALPLIAFFFWLFYRKAPYNYTEHLVANMYMAGFCLLASALLIVPLSNYFHVDGKTVALLNFVVEIVYFTIFYYHFLGKKTTGDFAKASLVSFTSLLIWFSISFFFVGLYISTGFWGLLS